MRCKAVQHAKNRADVRKTEGTGKNEYRSEAVRTVILGAVRAMQPACAGTAAVRAGCTGRRRPEGRVRASWMGRAGRPGLFAFGLCGGCRVSARGGAALRKPVRPGGYVPLQGLAGRTCKAK